MLGQEPDKVFKTLVTQGKSKNYYVFMVPVAEELEFMTAFGLEPLEAIRIGTSGGAEILDLQEVTGSIRPGLSADLLVVRGDPSRDIGALKSIHRVYYKGKTVFNLEGKDAAK